MNVSSLVVNPAHLRRLRAAALLIIATAAMAIVAIVGETVIDLLAPVPERVLAGIEVQIGSNPISRDHLWLATLVQVLPRALLCLGLVHLIRFGFACRAGSPFAAAATGGVLWFTVNAFVAQVLQLASPLMLIGLLRLLGADAPGTVEVNVTTSDLWGLLLTGMFAIVAFIGDMARDYVADSESIP